MQVDMQSVHSEIGPLGIGPTKTVSTFTFTSLSANSESITLQIVTIFAQRPTFQDCFIERRKETGHLHLKV